MLGPLPVFCDVVNAFSAASGQDIFGQDYSALVDRRSSWRCLEPSPMDPERTGRGLPWRWCVDSRTGLTIPLEFVGPVLAMYETHSANRADMCRDGWSWQQANPAGYRQNP